MAGTKPYTLETGFDPREMTLGEFIDFYAKESSEKGVDQTQIGLTRYEITQYIKIFKRTRN